MTLGIDVSTATLGWCIVTATRRIESCGYLSLTASTMNGKADMISEWAKSLTADNIHVVVVEQHASAYGIGQSSANTIINLAKINALTQYIVHTSLRDVTLTAVNVSSARARVVGKIPAKVKRKQFVFGWFLKSYPDADLLLPKKVDKRTKTAVYRPEAMDVVDAYVMSVAV